MLTLPELPELNLLGVADPGVPNKERIILRPNSFVELQRYFVGLAWLTDPANGFVLPYQDRIFYFSEAYPAQGDWIVLYTGKGERTTSELPTTGETAHSFFWGADTVLFHSPRVYPTLFRIAAMQIPRGGPLQLPGYKPAERPVPQLAPPGQ